MSNDSYQVSQKEWSREERSGQSTGRFIFRVFVILCCMASTYVFLRASLDDLYPIQKIQPLDVGQSRQKPFIHDPKDGKLTIHTRKQMEEEETSEENGHLNATVSVPTGTYNLYFEGNANLGNHMFQFASMYGLAKMSNRTPYFTQAMAFIPFPEKIFINLPLKFIPLWEWKERNLPKRAEKGEGIYTKRLWMDLPQSDVKIHGYLQSYKYFKGFDQDVRSMMVFRKRIINRAVNFMHEVNFKIAVRENNEKVTFDNKLTYIGIHVRRGDVVGPKAETVGYNAPNITYFKKAMHYFESKYKKCVFIVTSNEIGWCFTNLNQSNVFISRDKKAEVDLAILSMCNHTIISVGTFGWWAGYLAGGEVAYYKDVYIPGTYLGTHMKNKDFFMPHWVPFS